MSKNICDDHDQDKSLTMTQINPAAPTPQEDLQTVVQSRTREWHFHIYFLLQSPTEKAAALALRDAVLRLRRDGEQLFSLLGDAPTNRSQAHSSQCRCIESMSIR